MHENCFIPLADLNAQYLSLQQEIDTAIRCVIADSAFVSGPYVKKFESEFAAYCGADHCVGVGNGTDALFAALKGLGVGDGDEVLVPAMTFVATAEAVTMAGAKPVFVDIDPTTKTLSAEDLSQKVSAASRAIIPVHLYGQPANMEALEYVAQKHNLFVVQDAAQAHGATVHGRSLSSFGDCACYSFYPGKNLGAYGDGGAVVTNSSELADYIRRFANHGRSGKYDHAFEGVNSRLDGLQAAILSVKLKYLKEWTRQRRFLAGIYNQQLAGIENLTLPNSSDWAEHVYHLYVVQCKERDELQSYLKSRNISSGVHYPIALPFLDAYAACGHVVQDFPVAYKLQQRALSLPMYAELTEAQVVNVCSAIRSFFVSYSR